MLCVSIMAVDMLLCFILYTNYIKVCDIYQIPNNMQDTNVISTLNVPTGATLALVDDDDIHVQSCVSGGKPGTCPQISQEVCSNYTPRLDVVTCTFDYSCGETDKCCFDPCLNKYTCQLAATPRVSQQYYL
jgi:hypothetical protein